MIDEASPEDCDHWQPCASGELVVSTAAAPGAVGLRFFRRSMQLLYLYLHQVGLFSPLENTRRVIFFRSLVLSLMPLRTRAVTQLTRVDCRPSSSNSAHRVMRGASTP